MCSTIILMCLISVITRTSADVLFKIESHGNNMSCSQWEEKPANATVLEKEQLQLELQFPGRDQTFVNFFKCFGSHEKKQDVFVKGTQSPEITPKDKSAIFHSINATSAMSGVWNCTILTNMDTDIVNPMRKFENSVEGFPKGTYTTINCYVKVHVRLVETPQIILVNNMKLTTQRIEDTAQLVDHSAVYNYLDGDMVNVSCIPGYSVIEPAGRKYSIEFNYDYADNLDGMFKEWKDQPNELGYGFRTKLKVQHNNSVMKCKYLGPDDYIHTTIIVTFVLKEDLGGYIEANGLIGRPLGEVNGFNIVHFNIDYFCLKNEILNIVWKSNKNELQPEKKCIGPQSCLPQLGDTYSCGTYNSSTQVEAIRVNTNLLHKEFKETERLDVNLNKSNILIEVYNYKLQKRYSWIYYEFDEGDTVNLKCNKAWDGSDTPEVKYKLNNTVTIENTVTLTSNYNNTVFECQLQPKVEQGEEPPTFYKLIKVLFRKKHLPITTSTTTTTNSAPKGTERPQSITTPSTKLLDAFPPIWAIAAGAVVMCIVLSCVAIGIYKMRKRSQKTESGVNNYENLQNQNSQASIPPYPEQWARNEEQVYHVPVDIRNDSNTYAEPVRGQDNPYATPIPKSQRPPKSTQDNLDLTYAELDIASGGKTMYTKSEDPQYSTVKELYTQVVPKNRRKNSRGNYDNVFPDSRYVNSENTEYVEPTYCQSFK